MTRILALGARRGALLVLTGVVPWGWKVAVQRLWRSIMRLLDDWSFLWCAGPVAVSSFGFVIV